MGCLCCSEELDFTKDVGLNHFSLLRSVGKGSFGKVRVVEHKGSKLMFALKYINKAKCVKMRAVANTIQERRILEELSHPFMCNLRYAFQDDENLFMVLDLFLGGDLRFHLLESGPFSSKQIIFYAAEIGSALFYLHDKNIVHRDIKPDNLLLSSDGHVSLTDFNVAVKVRPDHKLTAFAGSLAYVAPEVFQKQYSFDVDFWSLGVTFYELLYGKVFTEDLTAKRPFRGKNHDSLVMDITNEVVSFPKITRESVEPVDCINFISLLLQRDISNRIGSKASGGFSTYKSHLIFLNIDWNNLEAKKIKAPFVPDPRKVNFDGQHELEELLLEDNPLTTQKRRTGARTSNTGEPLPPEYLILEQKFRDFDYTKREANKGQRRKGTLRPKAFGSPTDEEVIGTTYLAHDADETESITRDVMEEKGDEALKEATTSYREVENSANDLNSSG